MGQITHETVKCIEAEFERKDPGNKFPLTSWEKVQLARAWEQLQRVRVAVSDYHYALDTRQHGGVAQDKAFNAICAALGMQWRQGEEAARRRADGAGVQQPDGAKHG